MRYTLNPLSYICTIQHSTLHLESKLMTIKTINYPWSFQRIGGFDQVILTHANDIAHLDELDPKLWVALSCPASGLEFDNKMLSLLDEDKDGRIRIPEVINAVKWLRTRLNQLDNIIACVNELPLSTINTHTEDGKQLLITAKAILANINRADKESISIDDLNESTEININNLYNGDGVIPSTSKIDTDLQTFINDTLNIMGGVKDASGLDGINRDISNAFKQSLQDWLNWHEQLDLATTPFGNNTPEAWQLIQELKDKIDDYFLRSELASYAPQAQAALNVDEKYIVPTDNGLFENDALAELPLSKVLAGKSLELNLGLNPIWRDKIIRLAQLIKPFIKLEEQLTRAEWLNIQHIISPYAQVITSKPSLVNVATTIEPKMTMDKLGEQRIKQILLSDLFDRFDIIAEKDSKTPAPAADIADVEKLIIFHKHLYRLLMNFVSFHDFFDLKRKAAFQAGKLFIDGRCCSLCIPVTDIDKHTVLANYSELFLLYCECTRKNPPLNSPQQKKTIVAAMTAGDARFLLEGRNGVFIDNDNNDWDATVVKIITKPISLSQAIWDPYQRIGRFITEQINKWASSKDSAVMDSANKTIQNGDTTASRSFDIGRSVGILAAIGLAIGAIGTALASIASSLFQLEWWQFPLVFLAIFLIISGPSVILAWIKLRQRTLAPLLEASGWAINGRLKINFFFGGLLTSKAKLPQNAKHNRVDPTIKGHYKYWIAFLFALFIGCTTMGGWLWYQGYFTEQTEVTTSQPTTSATTPTTDTESQ